MVNYNRSKNSVKRKFSRAVIFSIRPQAGGLQFLKVPVTKWEGTDIIPPGIKRDWGRRLGRFDTGRK
jgi:hypothetical protein